MFCSSVLKRCIFVLQTAIERRKEEPEALPLKRATDDSTFQGTRGKQNVVPVLLGGSCPKGCETVGCNLGIKFTLLSKIDCIRFRESQTESDEVLSSVLWSLVVR